MSNKRYRFRCTWTTEPKLLVDRTKEVFAAWKRDIEAASPVSAINQFHSFLQQVREMAEDRRTVLRPLLKPDQYKVLSMHQYYHDAALHRDPSSQPIIESVIDYPNTPNPVVLHANGVGRDAPVEVGKSYAEFDFGPNNATD